MENYLLLFSSALFLAALSTKAESYWFIIQNSTCGLEKKELTS
tara:strand:+ start:453 stop:581 length:129 start_codon:yes stop_codon:yes gene_type:complete